MMFPLLSTGVMSSIFFGVNGNVMRLIQDYRSNRTENDDVDIRFCCDSVNVNNKYWHFDVFFAACVSGFSYTLINIPIEVVKTMLQASTSSINNNANKRSMITTKPMKLMIKLYKTNGIRSLYRGGTLLMLRDVPSMGVYMLTYEHLCSTLKKSLHTGNLMEIKIDPMPKYIQIISGGVAGVVSWILVLPFDVIKSKIIADSLTEPLYKGAYDCVKKTYKSSGTAGFFRGFWLVCIRAFPVNCISFFVYETLLEKCVIK
ncbi:Hypothetical protein CINCED_3A006547 [Cinara cedri]|nr:Hypothetical protein CINCED_3A006547 [Cinara cedri]